MKNTTTKKLKKFYSCAKIVNYIAIALGIIGFIIALGCIGNSDFAVSTHTIVSAAEEARTWRLSIISFIIMGASTGIAFGCHKICEKINMILYQRRKQNIFAYKHNLMQTNI